MLEIESLVRFLEMYDYAVYRTPYYLRISNPRKNLSTLISVKKKYGWWRLKVYLYIDRNIWNLPWKVFLRTIQLHAAIVESEKINQTKNK